jgi:hypothetical protein
MSCQISALTFFLAPETGTETHFTIQDFFTGM